MFSVFSQNKVVKFDEVVDKKTFVVGSFWFKF